MIPGFAFGTDFVPKPPIPGRPGGGGEMIPGFAFGTDFVPKPPIPGRPGGGGEMIPGGLRGLLGFAGGVTTIPDPREAANMKPGRSMSVPLPGSDVSDRWNTGLPMYAKGISKIPGKKAAKSSGKAAGLTPGLMAALLGQGMGAPAGGAPGEPMPTAPMLPPQMGR